MILPGQYVGLRRLAGGLLEGLHAEIAATQICHRPANYRRLHLKRAVENSADEVLVGFINVCGPQSDRITPDKASRVSGY